MRSKRVVGIVAVLAFVFALNSQAGVPGTVKWHIALGSEPHSPAVGDDGTIYIPSRYGWLYARNPDGSKKWSLYFGDSGVSTPVLGADGTIYVGALSKFYAVSPDGKEKRFIANGTGELSIGADGTLYFCRFDGLFGLHAYAPDGTHKWFFETDGGWPGAAPSVGPDGTIYLGSENGTLFAINPDGTEKWEFPTGSRIGSSPALGSDGTIYVGAADGNLYAIDSEGQQKWVFPTGGDIYASPAIAEDGTIYVGSFDYRLYAVTPDGTEKWSFLTYDFIGTSPALGADGTIYLAPHDGELYALTPDGEKRWEITVSLWWNKSAPAIGPDGTIYVGGNGGGTSEHFRAIYTDSGALADSPWPEYGQNNWNTSRRRPIDMPPVELQLDDPVEALLPAGEVHYYTVDAERARNLLIEVTPGEGVDDLVVDSGVDEVKYPGGGEYSTMVATHRGTYELLVSPTVDGTYVISVMGMRVAINGGSYTVTARYADSHLSDLSPHRGGNVGEVSVVIRGLGFAPGMQVVLDDPGSPTMIDGEINMASSTDLTARFDLDGASPGSYDLVATWPDSSQHSLENAFEVTPGNGPQLETRLSSPQAVRPGRQYVAWLEYANNGDIDAAAPLFLISSPQNVKMRLANEKPYSTDGLQVLGISFDDPAGVLRPGEGHRIPIFFEAEIAASIDIVVDQLTADDTAIDWEEIENEIRPDDMSDELWAAVWANFKTATGSTWEDYQKALSETATYLSRYGNPTYDAAELFGTLLQRASGGYMSEVHAFALDAFTPARGLPLFFSRVAFGGLYQRFTPGALGRGWSHAFEYQLKRPEVDRVVMRGPGGLTRLFFVDRHGSWRGLAGDFGRLIEGGDGAVTLAEKSGLAMDFDPAGRLVRIEEPNGNGLTLAYDGSRLETVTHSNGQSILLEYNADGLIQFLTDHAGRVTEYVYDSSGELLEGVIAPGGVTTAYDYRPPTGSAGDFALVSETHPDGTHTYYDHDAWGRMSSSWLDGGRETLSFSYDRYGTVVESDALNQGVTARFGANGELFEIENHLLERVRMTYGASLNVTRLILPDGSNTLFDYDPAGNPLEVKSPGGSVLRLSFERHPTRLDSFIDANEQLMDFEYESGNLTRVEYPDGSFEELTYDEDDGDLETVTTRRQDTVSYGHNDLGELTDIDWPDGTWFDFGHDEDERRWTFADVGGATTLDFDERGFLESVEEPRGHQVHYTYNDAGRRQRLETDDGFVLIYHYDDAGRLESMADGTGFEIVRYHYDEAGRLDREDRGNGTHTIYGYDAADRLLSVTHHAPDDGVQSVFSYTYDVNGNPESMTTAEGATTYGYDADGQLESVTYPGGRVVGYEYDAAGNREGVTDDGASTVYDVNELNQYTGVGSTLFTYDDNGSLENRTDVAGTTTFTWDPENRLQSIDTPADGTWTFHHDALGFRTSVEHDGASRHFVVDPVGMGNVIAEYDSGGDLEARYVHGLGLVARLDATGEFAYYNFDATGNTRQLTDGMGAVANAYDYSPFGIPLENSESVPNQFRYGGRFGVMDDGHGMLHMRARYYDPVTGHFLSPDPTGIAAGPNLYAYVFNSPVRYVDPSGLHAKKTKNRVYATGMRRNKAFWRIVTLEAEGNMKEAFEEYGEAVQENGQAMTAMAAELTWDTAMSWASMVFAGRFPISATAMDAYDIANDAYTAPGRNAPPPSEGAPSNNAASGSSSVIYPIDPNEKVGPPGAGPDRVVVAGRELPYTVYFENVSTATAPAQEVFVTDCLDRNLDWLSFRVNEVEFGDVVVSNPGEEPVFSERVGVPDYRAEEDKEWWVDVVTGFNLASGCLDVTLRMLDPDTGELPLDPFAGFLPPEDGTGRGQGHVSYSVSSKNDLEDGRLIRNLASIIFDTNEAIWTNLVLNTVGPQMWNLEVGLTGDGQGTVTSLPAGIDCGSTCQAYFVEGTEVELTPTPASHSFFIGWLGDADCSNGQVTIESDVSCTADFGFVHDVFADGFEAGDLSAWSDSEGGP